MCRRAAETIPAPAKEGWVRPGMLGIFTGGVVVRQPTAETIELKGSRGTVTVSAGYYVEAYETTPVEEIYHHGVARCDRPVINPAPAAEETWRWVPYRGKWAIAEAGNVHDPDGLHADAMHDGRWRVFRFGEATLASGQAKDIDSAKRVAEVAYRAYKTSAPPSDASFDAACDLIAAQPRLEDINVIGSELCEAALARALFDDRVWHEALRVAEVTERTVDAVGKVYVGTSPDVLAPVARVLDVMWNTTKRVERAEAEAQAQRLIARMR